MLVLVVGPSGAGKDTLIGEAKAALAADARFVFPRRVVTRPALSAVEDHDTLDEAAFEAAETRGAFALSWRAHGLAYGIPAAIADDLAAGRVVVVNVSRGVVGKASARFPGARTVVIDADPAIRARRLAARGRESEAEIAGRLAREVTASIPGALHIDGSASVAEGREAFMRLLRDLARI